MPRKEDFRADVPLPPGLEISAIRKAIEYMERELADLISVYFDQANIFSALVGIYGTKALDAVSNYEKHRHLDLAQQRFPDLRRRGSGPNPRPTESLESKGSKRPWPIQSHYDHPGWYIIWRYLRYSVDATMSIEPNKPVIIWRVDVVFLEKSGWKYEKSSAGETGGGRTHTFGVKNAAAKLRVRQCTSGTMCPSRMQSPWPEMAMATLPVNKFPSLLAQCLEPGTPAVCPPRS